MTTCVLCERVVFMQKMVMMTLIMVMVVVATVLWPGVPWHTLSSFRPCLALLPLSTTFFTTWYMSTHSYSLDSDIPQAALIAQVFLSSVLPYLACELNYNYLLLMEFITPRGSKSIYTMPELIYIKSWARDP